MVKFFPLRETHIYLKTFAIEKVPIFTICAVFDKILASLKVEKFVLCIGSSLIIVYMVGGMIMKTLDIYKQGAVN